MNRHKFDGVDPVVLYPLNMFVSLYLAAEPVVLVVMHINLRYFFYAAFMKRRLGNLVSALTSRSSGLGLSFGWGNCIVCLGETLNSDSQSLSLPPYSNGY